VSSSSALELEAPAKLNLFLEVCHRRPDGYHEIDSVFQTIDLCDTVRLQRADSITMAVGGPEGAPADATNLAWRAAEALGGGVAITLHKRIPPGAGLGGGSSDAAAVLIGLDQLRGLRTPAGRLAELALGLGADVPFFLQRGGAARCQGIGERVEPLQNPPDERFLLALPNIETSTERVYGALDAGLTETSETANFFVGKYFGRGGPGRASFFNRLQAVAERLDPRLREVRQGLEARYGATFTMSGSGSAYFARMDRDSGPVSPDGGFEVGGVVVRVLSVRTK